MTNIRILPDIVVSRIAAGEVIERPYSVVKELVENSLDASADRISIELKSGGKRYISVSDNGTGMTRDNAIMSLERHATSKISDVNDIFTLDTLGFRGEALPSIASVSDFILRTKTRDDLTGTEIKVSGGKIKKVTDTGCPAGTIVEVNRLFFNTPARLKFMKTVETELGRIIDIVQREAVSNYGVTFEISHNGSRVLDLRKRSGHLERIRDIIPGVELFEVRDSLGDNSVLGYMSSPLSARTTTQKLFTFVNGRPVKDRFVNRIIMDSYGKQIESGKYPQGVMFLNVPRAELDVNVHPTKHEIRFRNQKVIADLIKRSVGAMLAGAPWLREHYTFHTGGSSRLSERTGNYTESFELPSSGGAPGVNDNKLLPGGSSGVTDRNISHRMPDHAGSSYGIHEYRDRVGKSVNMFDRDRYFSGLEIVGQINNLYILCQSERGMVLIDQHAAHERVNYEKVKKIYYDKTGRDVQELLIPELIELSGDELNTFEDSTPELEKLGFIAERFGEKTVRLRAVPSLIGAVSVAEVFKDLLGELEDLGEGESFNETIDLICATIACHGSVRANQSLNTEQIRGLLAELDESESPYHCPHGRPVVRELTFDYLERLFRRTS